ncbi:alpha-L-fucosidase [Paenibacillus aceris]|uniref:alpha-L-fucosidase n=1 Tax=Paenibacillus aceris TaxID=869555 RepID=A0ABS4HW58_9BACL|nr:alpha-L-fucosidase [Paenibacillus aceris]MBP1962790.1 alpha-L-fucosidase [Paenibacillus aceris]NHW33848.1 oxidoreductase [Paenibacillus aceris]
MRNRSKKFVQVFLSCSLFVSMIHAIVLPEGSVQAASTTGQELLDVGFGGSFTSAKGYTASTGEVIDGALARRTGTESITAGQGVILNGGTDGIDYTPTVSFGTVTNDKPLLIEAKFKPKAATSQTALSPIIAIGGNMWVRYQSASTLEYGFYASNGAASETVKGTVPAPAADQDHVIALAYEPAGNGAVLQAFLDGKALPTVTSTLGKAARASAPKGEIGFGNDVHPSALSRGFKGSISRAVITGYSGTFDPSLLKLMSLSSVKRSLSLQGLGSLSNTTYTPAQDELLQGQLEVNGAQIAGLGRLNMSGAGSRIQFTPTVSLVSGGKLAADLVTEILAAPSAIRPGSVIMDVAGAVTLKRSATGESLEVLVNGQSKATVDMSGKFIGEYVHLGLYYDDRSDGTAAVSLWSGQQQLGQTIALTAKPNADRTNVIFAGDAGGTAAASMTGEVYGAAVGTVEGAFKADLMGLLGGPCTLPEGLQPGVRIPIKANECAAVLAEKASLVRPDQRQVDWQRYEQTAFLHFGVNTFTGQEWGTGDENPNVFQPTGLDTDQWARSLKAGGFKMAILTVKHHDGFLLYPSRYTDHDVASSSWRNGTGDVLREFVTSMHKYGIKAGVYLSPADENAYAKGIYANGSSRSERTIPTLVPGDDRTGKTDMPSFHLQATDYGAIFLNQLYEVLTEYGAIDEVWFDGSQGRIPAGKVENYDWDSYYSLIRSLAPHAVTAVSGTDVRWVGNESGSARTNEWSVLAAKTTPNGSLTYSPSYSSPDLGSRAALASGAANGMEYLTWFPAESDVSIRSGWFFHADQHPKSVSQLRDLYINNVGRNAVLLLNIPPDKSGKLPDEDVVRLADWQKQLKREFSMNLAAGAEVSADNGASDSDPKQANDGSYDTSWTSASKQPSSVTFKLGQPTTIDKVVLQEDINYGQQVESYTVDVRSSDGTWSPIVTASVIGYKQIFKMPTPVTGQEFRVRILGSRGPVHLAEFGLYRSVPANQPFADLSGDDSVDQGKPFVLNYGLNGVSGNMTQGVYAQDFTIDYDARAFEFVSAVSLKPSDVEVIQTSNPSPGKVRIILASLGGDHSVKQDGDLVQLNWKAKSSAPSAESKLTVSGVILADAAGQEIAAVGAEQGVTVRAVVDTAALNTLIQEVQAAHDGAVEGNLAGQYPVGSKQALQSAIHAARLVAGNEAATQAEVISAAAVLQAAFDAFKALIIIGNVDLTQLNTLINESQTIHDGAVEGTLAGQYPAGSKEALQAAIDAARSVVNNASVTQEQVNAAVAVLQSALNTFKSLVIQGTVGDVNGDGKVSIGDLGFAAANYGKNASSPDWNEVKQADVTHDNVIDINDLAAIANQIMQ